MTNLAGSWTCTQKVHKITTFSFSQPNWNILNHVCCKLPDWCWHTTRQAQVVIMLAVLVFYMSQVLTKAAVKPFHWVSITPFAEMLVLASKWDSNANYYEFVHRNIFEMRSWNHKQFFSFLYSPYLHTQIGCTSKGIKSKICSWTLRYLSCV